MNKYESAYWAYCPKCNTNVITTKFIKLKSPDNTYYLEVMERTCSHCGYKWFEEPLDAKEI